MRHSLPLFDDTAAITPASAQAPHLNHCFDAVPSDWRPITEAFRHSAAGQALVSRIQTDIAAGHTIYPHDVFAALRLTRLADVRVVILGQDPYHGPGQAHGLAFSVPDGVKVPPSLRNIYKELQRDVGMAPPVSGNLSDWAERGVLLLNTSLTVRDNEAGSHAGWGWEVLTDALIARVAATPSPKAFLLWGGHAKRKRALIEAQMTDLPDVHQLVLESNHPSPLSANHGATPFIGCGHFSQVHSFCLTHWPDAQLPWMAK